MSFEQFKTQVLLLHSEQSTLDNLSSGFNDRYTVHCATSGSEALNTLGETQITAVLRGRPGLSPGTRASLRAAARSPTPTIGSNAQRSPPNNRIWCSISCAISASV